MSRPCVLLLLVLVACSHQAPVRSPAPPAVATGVRSYAVVHVDHLQAGGLGPFASARKRWVDLLAKGGTTDGRGLYVQTGDSGFLSLRPLASMGDLDRSPALMKAALASIDPAAQKAYDDASDALLTPPHKSEIWRFDPDESFGVEDPMAALSSAAWGKMTVEEIDPTPKGDAYETAWKEIARALASEAYPLVRVAYFSRYGSGNLVSFWLAKSQQEFLGTPSVEATVAHALGAEAAQKLFDQQRKAVVASESVDVIPRPDLSTRPL